MGQPVKLILHFGRHYRLDTPRQRYGYARRPSCDTAIEGSAQKISGAAWPQPQDRRQMAEARLSASRADGAKDRPFDGSDA